ncbi:MAG: flavodoxin domain-containing protein [Roseiflexaceae bacterium]|nr:flavodoxin domain-containing protein [Roseiflexaceae bacterium]
MHMLLAVASKHGSTHEIADVLAAELRLAGHRAEVYDAAAAPSPRAYDAVILGSAIYAGSWLFTAKHFVERYRAELVGLPLWVFSSGPLGAENPQPHDDPQQLAAALGALPVRDHKVFVGKLDTHDLNVAERLIAKVVRAPTGDFRDWDAVRSWAHEIAAGLPIPADASA